MCKDLEKIDLLTRREIEATIVGPIIRAFMETFGEDATIAVVQQSIKSLARKSGEIRANEAGGNGISEFLTSGKKWEARGALQKEVLELSDTHCFYNVVRCGYAEMYKRLGMADLGVILSCGRDFDMVEAFNPRFNLIRTKTIMEGDDHCDFRIRIK